MGAENMITFSVPLIFGIPADSRMSKGKFLKESMLLQNSWLNSANTMPKPRAKAKP